MNDKTFEWSLTALSIIALLWMVLGSVFRVLGVAGVIITGLIVWIVGGGALLYFWAKIICPEYELQAYPHIHLLRLHIKLV